MVIDDKKQKIMISEGITQLHLVLQEKESQLIRKIHILFQRRFGRVSSVHFQALMMKKLGYKGYNERITARDNDNIQSHDQEESKLTQFITINLVN